MVGDHLRFDVFFSYSWANLSLARRIVAELRARGLTVFQDESSMRDFQEIAPEIDRALRSARCLVALYTPEFPRSQYCRWELYTALSCAYDLDGHTQRILPLLHGVDYADVMPRRLAGLRLPRPDTHAQVLAEAVAATVGAIDMRVFGDAAAGPAPRWYPYPAESARRLEGRLPELWRLHEALVVTDEADGSGPRVARLVGLGGQGKTMLAEEYARRFWRDHPGGVFILRGFGSHQRPDAEGVRLRTLRDRQVAAIVQQLGHRTTGLSAAEVDGLLRRELEHCRQRYLWVIDDLPTGVDATTFRALLAPTAAGNTLVTTRDAVTCLGGTRIDVSELDDEAAVRLLTSRRPATPRERQVVRQLACRDLGAHAQALDLAAGLSSASGFAGYEALRASIASPDQDALQLAAELRAELPAGHEASIAATLLRSIDKLSDAGRTVLQLTSLLAPAPVPESLLSAAMARVSFDAGAGGGEATAESPERAEALVRAGLQDAAGRSLARQLRASEPVLWAVHAMIMRAVRRADLSTARRATLRRAILDVLIQKLERGRETLRYRQLADYLPHVPAITELIGQQPDTWYARSEAGQAYAELGRPDDAVTTFSDLYEACRRSLGEHDPTTLAALAALGVLYGLRGEHRRAMDTKVRAQAILAAVLGADHPDTVTALNNIAVSHMELREPGRAVPVFAQVYRSRRRLLGVHHTATLVALGNLASAFNATGRHPLAFRLRVLIYQRLCRIRGRDDPRTLDALNNLGASHRARGDLVAARQAFQAAYQRRAQRLGPHHPDTLASLSNLAIVAGGRMLGLLEEAYRAAVLKGDPGTPVGLVALHNLLVCRGTGTARGSAASDQPAGGQPAVGDELVPLEDFDSNTDWRVEVFERAERVHADLVESAGPDDPATLVALCHLAHATAALNQVDQQLRGSVVLIEDAAQGLRELLGANHPDALLAERLRSWLVDLLDQRRYNR